MRMEFTYNRTYRGKVRLVVFDWAGTMVDYGCQAPIAAFVAGFKAKGVNVSMGAARIPMGMEKREHIKTVAAMDEVARLWQEVHGRAVREQDIDTMYDEFAALLLASIEAKSNLLPEVIEAVAELRKRNIKIGASTGYFTEAADIVVKKAASQGYAPDFTICASDVPAGRPEPWMIFRVMEALGIYPPEAVVNVGDTPIDIESALNAGVWSVGVAATGNQMGVTEAEIKTLPEEEYMSRLQKARNSLAAVGAHYVIDTMADLPSVIDSVEAALSAGARP
ncbi:phosphonoacetaldehyde hydrolase [Desulfopila sp. IMCC35008]|uniref:phosphonoacetaldehyde hydrolase n=1 Tax=Desulfopila sp. IMCC35008 TaxID=2653858 RepID=UPI0013D693D6|nr:phosphonoacetaldehyde hydrolase [Desulfopila sp. IMCC35008]